MGMSRTQLLSSDVQAVTDCLSSTRLQRELGAESPAVQNTNAQINICGTEPPKEATATTLWEQLSDQEKADCVDKLWGKKFNSQYRWDVKGRLRDEIWALKTHPVLLRLEEDNYTQIYGAGNKHMMRAFHISLLCHTKDCRAAYPVVLILIDVKKIGQRMKQIFENHHHFQDLNTGLRIEVIDSPMPRSHRLFRFTAAEDATSSEKPDSKLYESLCGAEVLVTKVPPTEESVWKRATIGGVICKPKTKEYFAVTVAHCFNFEGGSVDSSDDESNDSAILSQQSDTGDSNSGTAGGEQLPDLSEPASPTAWLPNTICGAYLEAENDRSSRRKNNLEQRPQSLAYIGDVDLRPNHSGHAASRNLSPQYSLDLDWALIRVRDARFMQRNQISAPWKQKLSPCSILINNNQPGSHAILAAQASGVRTVSFSATECSVRFPWSTNARRLWTLEADLAPGDSGSWVLSPDGNTVYGMVVASIPLLSIAYVIRAEDLFESILSTWSTKIAIRDMLPTNELKDLQAFPNGDSEAAYLQPMQFLTNDQASHPRSARLPRSVNRQTKPDPAVSDPRLGDEISSALASISSLGEMPQLEQQLYDEIKILRLRDRLPEAVVRFTEIVRGDHKACKSHIDQYPNVLEFDETLLIKEAIKAYQRRYLIFTHTCVERAVALRLLKRNNALYTAQGFFERLSRFDPPTTKALREGVETTLTEVYAKGNTIITALEAEVPVSSEHKRSRDLTFVGQHPGRFEHTSEMPSTLTRPSPRRRYETVQGSADGEFSGKRYLLPDTTKTSGEEEEEKESILAKVLKQTLYNTSFLDPGYHVQSPVFYRVGRAFDTPWHEAVHKVPPAAQALADPSTADPYGEKIHSSVRRMIVVREGHAYSWCVPIVTYERQNLTEPGLSWSDISSHDISSLVAIVSANSEPFLHPREHILTKKPISMVMAPYIYLSRWSRINFGRVYMIEHHVKARNIGMVSPESIRSLLRYFREEVSNDVQSRDSDTEELTTAAAETPGKATRRSKEKFRQWKPDFWGFFEG